MSGIFWGRIRVLENLWAEFCNQKTVPQADRWLHFQLKQNRKIGSQDRRWIRHYFFSLWRFAPLNFVLAEAWQGKTVKERLLDLYPKYGAGPDLMLALRSLDFRDLLAFTLLRAGEREAAQALDLSKEFLDYWDEFANLAQARMKEDQWQALWHGIPYDKLAAVLDRRRLSFDEEDFRKWLSMQSLRPPIWLRLSRREKSGSVERDLAEIPGLEIKAKHDFSLALATERQLTELPSYKSGEFEIQDLASQMISGLVQAQAGQTIWDACAGGGGKLLSIADAVEGKAYYYASDIRAWKLEEIKIRAKRAGVAHLKTFSWDASQAPDFPDHRLQQLGCDWVIVDAPCSASGTWRRTPDAKFRFQEQDLEDLKNLQSKILVQAAQAVSRSGYLVYATCSFFVFENENIIDSFLESEIGRGFQKVRQSLLGAPEFDADTMFACLLRRQP